MTESAMKTIRDFHALYSGNLASELRASGVPEQDAMPPWAQVYWLGRQVVKQPNDLWTYQEILWETQPDVLIETGTSGSGSAFYFASIMDHIGHGRVITVDVQSYQNIASDHPRITYIIGSSIDPRIITRIQYQAKGKVMVSLDSLHTYEHVACELEAYAPLVSVGQYLVVEDTGFGSAEGPERSGSGGYVWADGAVREFLARNENFTADVTREKHLSTSNHNGWLRRNS